MRAFGALFQNWMGGLRKFSFMGGVLALGLISIHPAWGHVLINESQKLLASDGGDQGNFGNSVSVSGDVALVGASGDDELGRYAGSAYIFRWNGITWVEEQKLLASDGNTRDQFGTSVSISGDVSLVGASGSAYIFRWNGSTWAEEQKLLASEGNPQDRFGLSVSLSGDVALVGAGGDDEVGSNTGSAYIFRWNGSTWVEEQKLLASDGNAEDYFGTSVSISRDVALVGASEDDDITGSAYIFRWNGNAWFEEQKLLASDGEIWNSFGCSVSVSGNVAIVGASWDHDLASFAGSAYIFRWNGGTWVEEQKLLASDGNTNDELGGSVSVSGDVALVGAGGDDEVGSNTGSAYIFRWNGSAWIEEQKLLASDGNTNDRLGISVSVNENVALVGASGDMDLGSYSGSAYIFDDNIYGDLNDDGIVDRADINMIRSHLNQPASVCAECDINGDGTINILDASRLTQFCTNDGCR